MNYTLDKVTLDKKEILYSLLQFALYDGSQYIENNLNENAKFQYKWFNNYFTDGNYVVKNNGTDEFFVFNNK